MDRPRVTKRTLDDPDEWTTMAASSTSVELRGVTGTRRLYALAPAKMAAEAR